MTTSAQNFDPTQLAQIFAEAQKAYLSQVQNSVTQQPANFTKLGPLDLSVAPINPLKLPSPIKSIILKDCTDDTVRVSFISHTDAGYGINNAFPLDHNDSLVFEQAIGQAWLTWAAQPGKTATIYVAVDAEIRSGKQISVSSGGVTISEGSGFTHQKVSLVAATATAIFAQDVSRKKGSFRNSSGASIWVGTSIVDNSTANQGFEVLPGDVFEWSNSAALYGYSVAGATLVTFTES